MQKITDMNMDMKDALRSAIAVRHSVRSYKPEPLAADVVAALEEEIGRCNREGDLRIRLVTGEPKAFKGLASYGKFTGVENYLVMAGPRKEWLSGRVGYYGERIVLFAQSLGVNSCWVGLTYRRVGDAFRLDGDERVACVIALGYGVTQGVARKSKSVEKVSNVGADSPEWFVRGVEAALLAPTATNQQKFFLELTGEKTADGKPVVDARRVFSLIGYTRMDMGIVRQHFELAAGTDNFAWKRPLE